MAPASVGEYCTSSLVCGTRRSFGTVMAILPDSPSGRMTPENESIFSIPWTWAGKLICMASDSSSVTAFMRTMAWPSLVTLTRQSTRFSPPAAIFTFWSALPPMTSRTPPSTSSVTLTSFSAFR